jgi:hypothetical protein
MILHGAVCYEALRNKSTKEGNIFFVEMAVPVAYIDGGCLLGILHMLRAITGGRATRKSRLDPTDLLAHRVPQDSTCVEPLIFYKEHSVFLLAKLANGLCGERRRHSGVGLAAEHQQRATRWLPAKRAIVPELFDVGVVLPPGF